jgi:osmotically-inducible protein OsmY
MPCLTEQAVLVERAENRLRSNPYLALKNITCSQAGDGALVLRGCLPSYYLKQVAQTVVGQVEGVRRVDNQIQVLAPTRREPLWD